MSSNVNFLSSRFIADNSRVKIDEVVFSKHDIWHFSDNVHLFKYYPVKVPQNCFNSLNHSDQSCIKVFKFLLALDK